MDAKDYEDDNLLGIPEIMARYRLQDARAARKIAREVGYIRVGGKMFVQSEDLDIWQQNSICRQDRSTITGMNGTVVSTANRAGTPAPLEQEWWLNG